MVIKYYLINFFQNVPIHTNNTNDLEELNIGEIDNEDLLQNHLGFSKPPHTLPRYWPSQLVPP